LKRFQPTGPSRLADPGKGYHARWTASYPLFSVKVGGSRYNLGMAQAEELIASLDAVWPRADPSEVPRSKGKDEGGKLIPPFRCLRGDGSHGSPLGFLTLSAPAGGYVLIDWIEARAERKGYGTIVLSIVCFEADRLGVELRLVPTADDPQRLEDLVRFYARQGFVGVNPFKKAGFEGKPSLMIRAPLS